VTGRISNSDNIEGTRVLLNVNDNTNTTSVASLGDHGNIARLELHVINDLASGDVNLDGIIYLDGRIRVSDGASVMGDNDRDLLQGKLSALDLAKLESLLLIRDSVKSILTLGIKDKSELIIGLRDFDNIHETGREVRIGSHLSINLDVLLDADDLSFTSSQGILQAVSQDEDKWQALSQLVRALGWARSPDTVHLGQHPMLGSI